MNQFLRRITSLYQRSIGSVRRLISFRKKAAEEASEAGNEAAPASDIGLPDSEPVIAGLEPTPEPLTGEESDALSPLKAEPDPGGAEAVDISDAVDLVIEPDHIDFQAGVDSEAVDLAREPGAGEDMTVEEPEVVDAAQAPAAIEAGGVEVSDIIDLARVPEPVELPAGDDPDVVDLASEPEVVRLDEGPTVDGESEIVRIGEEVETEAASVSGTGGEALDTPPSGEEQGAKGKKILGALGKIKGLAAFPLVKIKGIFKKDRQPAADLGPGFALGTGQGETRRRFRIPGPLAKAFTVAFIIVCLVAGGLVGLKVSNIYSSKTAGQQAEPGAQTPSETTPQGTTKTGSPAASSKSTGSPDQPTVQPLEHPTTNPPDRPIVQQPDHPTAQPPTRPTSPDLVDIPDKGKYDEPPYSKDVYKKGLQ